jgi:2-hydroxy-3-oxopropionate reductase
MTEQGGGAANPEQAGIAGAGAAAGAAGGGRRERIGFIGLGIMGKPMALNLLRAGFPLVVHSRSRGPVDELVAAGAEAADTPFETASRADVAITMLPDTPDLELVIRGAYGLLGALRPGHLLIDMSTVDPIATRTLADVVQETGAAYVDAPVSGGQQGAQDAALSIMIGGSQEDVARAMPIFEAMGKTITHVGDVGAGQVTKASNQLVVAATLQAVSEALTLAESAGVDPGRVRQALLGGFAASRILDVHGQRMLDDSFAPGFRARLLLKDIRIVSRTARELRMAAPSVEMVEGRLNALVDSGRGDLDHSSLVLLERESRAKE